LSSFSALSSLRFGSVGSIRLLSVRCLCLATSSSLRYIVLINLGSTCFEAVLMAASYHISHHVALRVHHPSTGMDGRGQGTTTIEKTMNEWRRRGG
ncbi:hypothetical protein PENTCL1PPCAC_6054, partial [Pristionchus entomophagus]